MFYPFSLLTPISAGFKLDLHQLWELQLNWDDPGPTALLDRWAANMENIKHAARECHFQTGSHTCTVRWMNVLFNKIQFVPLMQNYI